MIKIEGVETKELKIIKDERGFLMEMLRNDEPIFQKFGQVYLSVCNPGFAKGWHYHKKQTDLFVVVKGNGKIVMYDNRPESRTRGQVNEFIIGENNPVLVTIPPYVIHGMSPADGNPIYLVNCCTEPYDRKNPDEYRLPFDSKEVPYKWDAKKGG